LGSGDHLVNARETVSMRVVGCGGEFDNCLPKGAASWV